MEQTDEACEQGPWEHLSIGMPPASAAHELWEALTENESVLWDARTGKPVGKYTVARYMGWETESDEIHRKHLKAVKDLL